MNHDHAHEHHSHSHNHGHSHSHHHNHNSESSHPDEYDDMEIPRWKQRALAMGIGGADSYRNPPFGQTWDSQVSISVMQANTYGSSMATRLASCKYHAHFDCFSGAAGDMMLAACLDASPNPTQLLQTIIQNLRLGIPDIADEFNIRMEKVSRGYGCICGTKVTVDSTYHHQAAPVPQDHSSFHAEGPLRNLPQIRHLLTHSDPLHIPMIVRHRAIDTFTELAMAESYTHGSSSLDHVHFHEVGAIDSIVDIVGTLLALYHLNIQTFSCSRLPMGEGMVRTDHGQLPVPAFATLRLMVGMKTCKGPGGHQMTGELVTPTAAALLRVLTGVASSTVTSDFDLTSRQGRPPPFTPRFIGIGAGTKDFPDHANILRLIIGDDVLLEKVRSDQSMVESPCTQLKVDNDKVSLDKVDRLNTNNTLKTDTTTLVVDRQETSHSSLPLYQIDLLTLLEANIDDATPEILAYAVDLLLSKGAVDAWVQPIVMKKGRSAHMLSCLLRSTDDSIISSFIQLIFRNTTTIGLRIQRNIERAALHRKIVEVSTPYSSEEENGKVDVKVCFMGNEILSMKPEFDHCKRIAQRMGISVESVSTSAKAKAAIILSNGGIEDIKVKK